MVVRLGSLMALKWYLCFRVQVLMSNDDILLNLTDKRDILNETTGYLPVLLAVTSKYFKPKHDLFLQQMQHHNRNVKIGT